MPSINMIAARRAEKAKLEEHVRIMFIVLVGEFAIMLALLSFMSARIYGTGRTADELDQKLKSVQPTVEKIRYYNGEITKLGPKLDLLADSREDTLLWRNILQRLGHDMPAKTWLGSVSSVSAVANSSPGGAVDSSKSGGPQLLLRGVSANQALVGETMLRLNQFPEIDRVDLNFTQKGSSNTIDTVEFDIAATLKQNKSAKGGSSSNAKN